MCSGCALFQVLVSFRFRSHLQLLFPLQTLEIFAGPEAQGCGISIEASPQTRIELFHSQIPAFRAADGMVALGFLQWCGGILWQKKENRKNHKIPLFHVKNLRFYAVFQNPP